MGAPLSQQKSVANEKLRDFVNSYLKEVGKEELWVQGKSYTPGDVVHGSLKGIVLQEKFQCRQEPFGDFCSKYDPLSLQGITAWRAFDSSNQEVPEPSQMHFKCVEIDQAVNDGYKFKSGDMVCDGERYVWNCKDVSASDWCNLYPIGSKYSYLAWELVDAYPKPIENVADETKERPDVDTNAEYPNEPASVDDSSYDEPDADYVEGLHDPYPFLDDFTSVLDAYVLPYSLTEYWDNFYADNCPHFYNEVLTAKGDEPLNWNETWYTPFEEEYLEWYGQQVVQQRDLEMAFDIPPNPIIRHATTNKHWMLLEKTDSNIKIAVINNQQGYPYATDFEFFEQWDIRTPDPRSNQISIRHQYKINWIHKPRMIGGMIERIGVDKMYDAVSFFKSYAEGKMAEIVGKRASVSVEALMSTGSSYSLTFGHETLESPENEVTGALPTTWTQTQMTGAGMVASVAVVFAVVAGLTCRRQRKLRERRSKQFGFGAPLTTDQSVNHLDLINDA